MMLLCSLQGKRRWISQVGIVNAGEYFNEQNVYIVEFVKSRLGEAAVLFPIEAVGRDILAARVLGARRRLCGRGRARNVVKVVWA